MTVREPTYKPAVNWKTCSRSSTCIGVAIHDGGPCLAHAEESSVTSAITQLKETGAIDGRGVRFSGPLLQRLLASLPRDIGRRWLGQALFDQATFTGEANFDGIAFRGDARFYYATFERRAGFQDARFEADAWFEGARFRARTVFMVANFENLARFEDSFFTKEVWLHRARFKGGTWFDNATFLDLLWLSETVFETARDLGPILVHKELRLDGSLFKERITIEAVTPKLICKGVRFPAGVQIRVRWAEVILDDAEFAASSLLIGVPSIDANFDEAEFAKTLTEIPPSMPRGQPWLASLRRADVKGLTIASVDLRACRFAGAHNLDRLGLESPGAFTLTPSLKAVASGWAWPPVWWWTRRQTIAEEHTWRAAHERGIRKVGWHADKPWRASTNRWVPNPTRPPRDLGRLQRHLANTAADWRRPHRLRRRLVLGWRIGATRAAWERARRRQAVGMRQQQNGNAPPCRPTVQRGARCPHPLLAGGGLRPTSLAGHRSARLSAYARSMAIGVSPWVRQSAGDDLLGGAALQHQDRGRAAAQGPAGTHPVGRRGSDHRARRRSCTAWPGYPLDPGPCQALTQRAASPKAANERSPIVASETVTKTTHGRQHLRNSRSWPCRATLKG